MTLLEKLKELSATTGRRNGNEDLGHWADREKHENTWIREEALPALIAVAEAAVKYISKRVEYAGYERQYEILKRVENKTTMQEMEMSTVDAERERAELELCDAWDNLNAALAALEVEA